MNGITHVLATSALILLLGINQKTDIVLAYVFGVLIDLDHALKIFSYIKENGLKYVKHWKWRTFLQEPVFLLFVIPFSFIMGTYVPILFFSLHLVMDYLCEYEKKPFWPFSDKIVKGFKHSIIIELMIACISAAVIIFYYLN